MTALKSLNLAVRFLLELAMLAAAAYWGFATQSGWTMKILLGIGLPLLLILIWSRLLAPRAPSRLTGIAYIVLSLVLLGSGAVALFASGQAALGWIYAIVLVINQALLVLWKQ